MSVLVDTGVFFAHHDRDAERHDAAVETFDNLLDGAYGQPYTCDYVLDETVTLTRVRTGSFEAADTVVSRILGEEPFPDVFEMVHAGPAEVRGALEMFRTYDDHDLSFTDAMLVHLCEHRDIDAVLSFDDDFDGVVNRIEPGR
ncbi:type II toxin-antitoxin system VapC family toxin [Haloarchaeobius sp. HME9146]|uniref:type II toxin-antitoxin system VapC family toxin n=1 Tax=Haloarchaeobius sp. HME9146 TaxID=2978732 RepID=UPI0021C1D42D|nr:PIN domain-containing protein [Haloarchaeobius sp. HME9146]MCT9095440.1 PIN domain-containing protein [Haloarchaeobius sp. HME9146]